MCFVGGLGSGKTISSVKESIILLRKQRFFKYKLYNFWCVKVYNRIIKIINKINTKTNEKRKRKAVRYAKKHNKPLPKIAELKLKTIHNLRVKRKNPMLYCNIPIHFKKSMWSRKREWSKTLKASHILCLEEMREYSIVMIDELPQFINQFNWNQELIQKNVNEFITFFRHYIGGYLVVNAQAIDDVVVQIRRKLNQATWCFDFHKWGLPIPLFYTIRMCDLMLSDSVQTMSTTYIEENTRLHFALFPPRKTYDSRCYSPRYQNVYKKYEIDERYKNLKTTKVLRLVKYESPLDDTTTQEQKQEQWRKGESVWRN